MNKPAGCRTTQAREVRLVDSALRTDLGRASVRQAQRDREQDARLAALEQTVAALVERVVALETR